MYQTIGEFHKQFLFEVSSKVKMWPGSLARLFYIGMGGSGLPADLVNDYLGDEPLLNIVRDYRLPTGSPSPQPSPVKGEGNLVLCASYSGNTEETLSALDDALSRGTRIVILTHGGKLKERAIKEKIPLIEIPECIQPRCAAGYFFSAILGVLERLGKIPPQEAKLKALSHFLEQRREIHEQKGKELASRLKDHIPIIYGPTELQGTCRFWKIKFNENSKIPSFFNVFPELNHNEMVGWTHPLMKPTFIFLRSKFMHPRVARRMDVTKELFKGKIPIHEIHLEGENHLQEMFDSLAIADYASYYLALYYGVDPAAVEMVEEFKKKLGQFSFGCMAGSIRIIGDIISPACDEEEWEVLRDDENV